MKRRAEETIGKTYGRLEVKDVFRKNGLTYCHCLCDCGNEKDVIYSNIVDGKTKSCGCLEYENRHKHKDLVGQSFGDFTVRRKTENRKAGMILWECSCKKCGEIRLRTIKDLRSGWKILCSKTVQKREGRNRSNLEGKRFDRLQVIKETQKRDYKGSVVWKCLCDCGTKKEYSADMLVHGNTVSCGCKKKEIVSNIRQTLTFVDHTCVEWLKFRKSRKDNTSGFRGVYKKNNGKYQVMIGLQKKRYNVGLFDTFEQAVEARLEVENKLHGGFIEAYSKWEKRVAMNPKYSENNSFQFYVQQIDGEFYTHSNIDNDESILLKK